MCIASGAMKMVFSTLAKIVGIHNRKHNKDVVTRIALIVEHDW